MYLQSFEERTSASGADRRRNVRVKPDELGRFKFEDLGPRAAETSMRASRSPWFMAIGGAVVGAIIYSMVPGHGHDSTPSTSVEARAFETSDGKAERQTASKRDERASKPAEVASRRDEASKPAAPKARTIPPEEMLPPPVTATAAKPAGDVAQRQSVAAPEQPRQLAERSLVASSQVAPKPEYTIVPVETAGAMVPMAGPDEAGAGDDEALQVMQ
jgi:hypothetical protein